MLSNLFEIATPIKLRSWKAIITPLFLGTGVFTILYLYSVCAKLPGSDQRGLFEYYSTTFGDILIVPLTWLLMSKHYSLSQFSGKERSKLTVPIVIVSVLILTSIYTINSMYGNARDWTLPTYGSINIQGIYHSLFIAFMLSSYAVFILDHWYVMSRASLDLSTKNNLSFLYWCIVDLFLLFLAFLSSDAYYNATVKSFFINPPQQFVIFILLVLNFIMTIRNQAVPFSNLFLFTSTQIAVYILTTILGYLLSKYPIMW